VIREHKAGSSGAGIVPWDYYVLNPGLDEAKTHTSDGWFTREMELAYPDAKVRQSVKILVIPSRWGECVRMLQEAGFDAHGGDISEKGRMWGGERGTRNLHHADITDMRGFSNSEFDVVYCPNLYDVGADPRAVFELSRVTKPGGRVYFIGSSRVDSALFESHGLSVAQEYSVSGLKNSGSFRLVKEPPKEING